MKKYLMLALAAVVFASCSKSEDVSDSSRSLVTDSYKAAFLKYVGGSIAPDQTWGFSSNAYASAPSMAFTRSVIKTDMTNYPTTGNPDPITAAEAAWVTNWFQNNPGLSEEGQPFTNFYVQFVSGDQNNKKGIWHRYDQNRINNGYESNYYDEEFTDNGGMDKLHVGATRDQNATDHLLDFNAKTGGPWDVVYIENGSALQFGYHSSWGEDSKAPAGDGYYWYFKMVELEVPGSCFTDGVARKGWYVGLSLYGKKYDNGDKELGYQRLQYAEDWIVKVVPAQSTTTIPTGDIRIIAEDLSASEESDFDFNDIVVDVVYGSPAKLVLQAAGGTLPLRINNNDNLEVHKLFGVNVSDMVNTGSGPSKDPVVIDTNLGFNTSINSAEEAKNLKIEVQKDGQWYELSAPKGEPASKLAVDNTYTWLTERQSIKGTYKLFVDWASQANFKSKWW